MDRLVSTEEQGTEMPPPHPPHGKGSGTSEDGLYFRRRALSISGWLLLVIAVYMPNALLFICTAELANNPRGILAFGPPLPFNLTIQERANFTFISFAFTFALFFALVVVDIWRMGTFASGIRIHDGLFDLLRKNETPRASIQAETVNKILAVNNTLMEGRAFRITLQDTTGRKYTLRNSTDTALLVPLAEFCQRAHIEYEYRKDAVEPLMLFVLLAAIAEVFALYFIRHPFPVAISITLIMLFFQVICHKIVVRNMK